MYRPYILEFHRKKRLHSETKPRNCLWMGKWVIPCLAAERGLPLDSERGHRYICISGSSRGANLAPRNAPRKSTPRPHIYWQGCLRQTGQSGQCAPHPGKFVWSRTRTLSSYESAHVDGFVPEAQKWEFGLGFTTPALLNWPSKLIGIQRKLQEKVVIIT